MSGRQEGKEVIERKQEYMYSYEKRLNRERERERMGDRREKKYLRDSRNIVIYAERERQRDR